MKHNFHAIEGPNGMCACGVRADGTVVTCGALLEQEISERTAALRASLEAAQRFLPIETAPLDGTPVLLCWDDGIAAARFDVGFNLGGGRMWQDTHQWLHNAESWPTHWMPLPKPPLASSGAETQNTTGGQ